jgi:Amt family ammonium transporter
MTPGLAFFYGGLVRNKHIINTIMMSFISMGVVTVHWVIFGYSFAFGPGNPIYGSEKYIGMMNVGAEPNPVYSTTVPHSLYCVYQMMFAAITPAIISGAIVERIKFSTFLIFVFVWTTLVYDMVAHWVWSAYEENVNGEVVVKFGWLRALGSLDFAGGTAVHIASGVSALVAAWVTTEKKDVKSKKTS